VDKLFFLQRAREAEAGIVTVFWVVDCDFDALYFGVFERRGGDHQCVVQDLSRQNLAGRRTPGQKGVRIARPYLIYLLVVFKRRPRTENKHQVGFISHRFDRFDVVAGLG
jgi:hypothetical protein